MMWYWYNIDEVGQSLDTVFSGKKTPESGLVRKCIAKDLVRYPDLLLIEIK